MDLFSYNLNHLSHLIYFSKNLIYESSVYFLTPQDQIQKFYKEYLFVRMIGLPAGLINMVFLGWFFGIQKTKSVMLQVIIINLVNIFSSLYFSVFLELGIYGVAIGSVCAQISGLFVSIVIFLNYYNSFLLFVDNFY